MVRSHAPQTDPVRGRNPHVLAGRLSDPRGSAIAPNSSIIGGARPEYRHWCLTRAAVSRALFRSPNYKKPRKRPASHNVELVGLEPTTSWVRSRTAAEVEVCRLQGVRGTRRQASYAPMASDVVRSWSIEALLAMSA